MSNENQSSIYAIGGRRIKGGTPTNGQILSFNAASNLWEFTSIAGIYAKVIKSADQSKASLTNPSDDSELIIALATNKTYAVIGMINFTSPPNADFRYNLNYTGTTSLFQKSRGVYDASIAPDMWVGSGDQDVVSSAIRQNLMINCVITTTSAGNLVFRWAQAISDPSPTTVNKGSLLLVIEI